jgi:capsular polysaccharide biosynthesis protein
MTFLGVLVRVLLVAVIAAGVGVAALLFSRAQPTRYQAEAKLTFSAATRPELQVLGSGFSRPTIDPVTFTATNAELVASHRVAAEVADARPELGLSADEVADRISVSPVSGTELVEVRASGETPGAARELAQTYLTEFRRWFRSRERSRAREVRRVLADRYDEFSQSQRESDTGASVRDQLSALTILEEVGSGSPDVVEGAHGSGSPQQPQTRRNVLFGVIFGLAVGIGLVALRAELTRRTEPPSRPAS